MCLVAFALDAHPEFSLVIAANRDEVLARPSAPIGRWPDAPGIVGGRDLDKGGTWLAIAEDGRLGLVTNYRDFRRARRTDAPSRGALVRDYLRGDADAPTFLAELSSRDASFEPYNVVLGDAHRLTWHTNVTGDTRALEPGRIHGLSNALLDTPWPKVTDLMTAMEASLAKFSGVERLEADLLAALARRDRAPAERLPDTGVGPELEAALSPAFIRIDAYGTRCSSVITVNRAGGVRFVERTYDAAGQGAGTRVVALTVPA